MSLLALLGLLGRATESRAAYTGPPTLRRTKAGLGAGVRRRRGDGRCCCLCRRRCPALSHHHHHQADTDITIYWSLLSVPSITEYKALQIQAWPLLISGHHRPDIVTLTSTYLYPGPVQHSVQCPPCPATGQN